MRAINIEKENIGLNQIVSLARKESILLLSGADEFIISRADDFESEVEAIRNSSNFQSFLDERMKCETRFPIEEVEKEVENELSGESCHARDARK